MIITIQIRMKIRSKLYGNKLFIPFYLSAKSSNGQEIF